MLLHLREIDRLPMPAKASAAFKGTVCISAFGICWHTVTGRGVKGKDANGVGSQQPSTVCRNTVYTIAVR